MPDSEALLAAIRAEVPGCIAALMVSLEDGTAGPMAGKIDAGWLDAVATAGRDLFARNDVAGDTREVVVLSDDYLYVYRRLASWIVAVICRDASNIGLSLGMVRQLLESAR